MCKYTYILLAKKAGIVYNNGNKVSFLVFSTNNFVFSTNKLEKNVSIFNCLLYNENTKIQFILERNKWRTTKI